MSSGRAGRRRILASAAHVVGVLTLSAPSAAAGEPLRTDVTVAHPVERSCIDHRLSGGEGYASRAFEAPAPGWVTARLDAAAGDWDVAVFDDATGHRIAGSAFSGANEVAQGFVAGGEALTVQVCRRSGAAHAAALTVDSQVVRATAPATLSLVKVSTPTAARKRELTELGLDLTEHGGRGFVDVVLHGSEDAARLRDAKFTFTSVVANLAARAAADRRADRGYRAEVEQSALPSGRTAYRRLADYSQEMKALAAANPSLVKPITLPFKTLTGMSVEGVEITKDVDARDGKPVFLQMGAHHAREWPSSEHAMEWGYELVNGSRSGDPRVKRLLESTRTIVVPVVNPEGFNTSREAASAMADGRGGPDETANLALAYEYQRKNCRVNNPNGDDPPQGDCAQPGQPATGVSQFGVDPNRNYGGLWGGPGASAGGPAPFGDFAPDYRGSAPFSEPETQNIRALVSSRQVTTLITNHTFSNLILRPPGVQAQGPSFDEPAYKALADAMAGRNGYTSQLSYQLYDTTGTTEDWSYPATGGLGFTFEIGPRNFHPPYAQTVAEYEGTAPAAGAGRGGNREAYFTALESTADASKHSLIEGGAPAGAVLRLRKTFKTSTSPLLDENGGLGAPILFDDTLDTTMVVPDSGAFAWHINPSTRPIVAEGKGRPPNGGAPSPAIQRTNRPASNPPCRTYFELPGSCVTGITDEQFDIPANQPGAVDNGLATVKLSFPAGADMDLEIYRAEADGGATGSPIGASSGTTNPEQTTIGPDPAPGRYVARVVNYAGGSTYDLTVSFAGPAPFTPGKSESWVLSCEVGGRVRASRSVTIKRGERQPIDFGSACPRTARSRAGGTTGARRCASTRGGIRGRSVGRTRLGRKRGYQRRLLRRVARLRSRKGIDRYCQAGGGVLQLGYPTARLVRALGARRRKRVQRKAILAISTSRRFRVRGLKVGSSAAALRRRLRGERRFRVGRSVWFTLRGRRSTLLLRTRGRKVRELGLGNRSLTATRRGTARFLRAW